MAWAIVAAVLAFLTLFPVAVMTAAWSYFAWRLRHPYTAPHPLPHVAVLLPLRGADPSLEACLCGLLAQDYPAYDVHVVVDRAEDSAHAVVAEVLERAPAQARVHVHTRRILGEHCSPKLSAQRQILTELDDTVTVVAFLDADSIPASNWLRAMVAPFSDPRVGATTGVRWSAPLDGGWGTLARYVFNALSYPQRFLYRIPWGGSLAVRTAALRQSGLIDHWTRCLCEDTSAYGPLRKAGLRLAFVPAATQINSESIDLGGARYFMLRQLVCVHLHHVNWPLMLGVNVATITSFLICGLLALVGLVGVVMRLFGSATRLWELTAFAIIPAFYFAGLLAALAIGDRLVRRVVAAPPGPKGLLTLIVAAAIALAYSAHAMLMAPLMRKIDWRGITYDIEGRDRVRMRSYQPYRAAAAVTKRSIL